MNKLLLKRDLFGEVWQIAVGDEPAILRDTRAARWWVRWLARFLMRREKKVLAAVTNMPNVPQLLSSDAYSLTRTFLSGVPMHEGRPASPRYFRDAARLLRRLHRAGVTHNDLAKEANILVQNDGSPAFIDFQLAAFTPRRGRLFRLAAREDIRHLLKHKRTYCADHLTARERSILETPSCVSRVWMSVFKPIYIFVTRRLLGWSDREGAADR